MRKVLWLIIFLFLLEFSSVAQDKIPIEQKDYENTSVEMADQFRAEGKIYIVIALIIVIFAGIVVYMVRLEGKLKEVEKQISGSQA